MSACPFYISGQALSMPIPLNENAIEGQLTNGLRYIVHKNPNPAGKIEFRLVLNVGSILEKPKEKGMSHFLEHMVFNGSKDYPGNLATQLLQGMGIKYGYDLNAFTDNDKTIYILPTPTDKKENIDTALNIFYNWLTSLNLYPTDIEKEKKIVIQEIKDAGIQDIFYSTKVSNSRYADRPVLGSKNSVQQFDSLSIRYYYDRWYRPDLATIIAVGDLDVKEIEQQIKDRFGNIKPRINKVIKRQYYSLPLKGQALLQQKQDTLLSSTKLDIIFPETVNPISTYQDLYNSLSEQLFKNILSARISKDKSLKCYYSKAWYLSNISHHSFEISAQSDTSIYASVERMGYLLAQIKQHGFLPDEIEYSKKSLLKSLNKDDFSRTSDSFCNDYIDLAVTGDRYIGNKAKYDFYTESIKKIKADDLVRMLDVFFEPNHLILLCNLYNPQLSASLNKDEILKHWHKGLNTKTSEYLFSGKNEEQSETQFNGEIVVHNLTKSHIISEKQYENIQVTELLLSNGLRVALRPTSESDNKNIMINLVGRGGFSVLPIDKYPYFSGAAAYVDMSGIDTLSSDHLNELCYKKEIALSTNIDNYYHELYGIAFEGNIDDLLKLLYLKITSLNKNKTDFDSDIKSQIAAIGKDDLLLKQFNRDPERVLQNKIAYYAGYTHRNNQILTTEKDILKIDLDANISFFQQLFNNGDLTAVITGDFDPDSIKDKVVMYLGALPNFKTKLQMHDIGNHFPENGKREIIEDENASRTNVTTLLYGKYEQSLKESIIFKMMRDIINTRMLESLREKEGLVYSPYANVSYRAYPTPEFYFNINYYCDKEHISYLEKRLWENLETLRTSLITESELSNIKQSFLISKREHLSEGNTAEWRNKLKEMYLENNSISDFNNYDNILFNISVEDIRDSFQKYITTNRYMIISITN